MGTVLREKATALNPVHEQRQFINRLTETITWCREVGALSDPKTSLRTCKLELDDLNSQDHQVFRVALERSRRLYSAGKRDLQPVANLCGGRLLAYFPNDSLACGMAELTSRGFFDADNIPPHDTWVWLVRNIRSFIYEDGAPGEMDGNYLVAWVPPEFISLADSGMNVNPEGCIVWLDTMDDEFTRCVQGIRLRS